MRRDYVSCLGKHCILENDELECGYNRLENERGETESNANIGRRTPTEEDYFRSPDSYQWSGDPGEVHNQESPVVDQNSHSYTDGVHIQQSQKNRRKLQKKTLRKRIRHFLRVSFKWIRRGLTTVSPVVTPHIVMNPAMVMTGVSPGKRIENSKRGMVFL